jgi:acetylornithine aminotransferase
VVTLAKGLGGGIPIGATVALGGAGELLQPGNHGTTFGGNPVATSAALAVIDTIDDDGLLANASVVGRRLRDGLAGHPLVREVSGRGLLLGIGLHADVGQQAYEAALAAGVIVNCCAPDRLRLAPPLVLSEAEADFAVVTLRAVLDQVSP